MTAANKIQIFDSLLEGFRDAIARKTGLPTALGVTEMPRVKHVRPTRPKKRETILRLH